MANYVNFGMMKTERNIPTEVKRLVHSVEPSAKVYLYGSKARGTSGKESDWDLLILLSGERVTPEKEKAITDPIYDLEFDTGEVISPMVYSEKEWHGKYRVTPYYKNVMREGTLL